MNETNSLQNALQLWVDTFMSHSMRSWMTFVRASGLSMPQFSFLMRLHYRGQCDVGDASAHLGITKAAASQMVDKLVELGYLTRLEDPKDRRYKVLSLSGAGKQLLEQGQAMRNQGIAELAELLPPERHAEILLSLQELTRCMLLLHKTDDEPMTARPETPNPR
jgi:DNA-binding MarR family transcriptional regulator